MLPYIQKSWLDILAIGCVNQMCYSRAQRSIIVLYIYIYPYSSSAVLFTAAVKIILPQKRSCLCKKNICTIRVQLASTIIIYLGISGHIKYITE